MSPEHIIIGTLIIGSIAGMIWIAPDIRDAFREPFGDISEIPKIDEPKGD